MFVLLPLCLALGAPVAMQAQRADSGRVAAAPARTPAITKPKESITGPPISPRRAFLYSLLLPGLGQSKLDRPNAGALYFAVEVGSLAMIRKSAWSLGTAEHYPDSIIVGYSPTDSVLRFTARGVPYKVPKPLMEGTNLPLRVASRKTQVEDWIAVLIFNHFFAGADAFVAAQLWDLPAVVTARPTPTGATVSARVSW